MAWIDPIKFECITSDSFRNDVFMGIEWSDGEILPRFVAQYQQYPTLKRVGNGA